jgi:hypothetical protein
MSQQAESLAARVSRERPEDPAGRALQLAFGRPATAVEKATLSAFLDTQAGRYKGADARKQALADLCHMLLSANEFAYVD